MDRYRFAAIAAFCVTLFACNAVQQEPTKGEEAYRQKLADAESLIARGLRTVRRAEDASLPDGARTQARVRLEEAVCPSYRALVAELRAEHERVYNALEQPFATPASWRDLDEWCDDQE